MTSMDLDRMIDVAAEAAQKWDAKGDANWAARNYVQAALAALRAAVKQADEGSGIAFLRDRGAPQFLSRAVDLSEGLSREIESGRVPASVIGGNYHLSVLGHLAWILDATDAASRSLAVANQSSQRGLSTPFWNEYALALECLDRGRPYDAPERQWKKERYWAPYLEVIADLVHGRKVSNSAARASSAFQERNQNKRFLDDPYGVEGSGREPARWDFRLVSLVRKSLLR
jgi:hypothetical protein